MKVFLNLSLEIYLTGGLENVKLGMLIKNTILVTPDTTFIRRDQKQGRNRETCQAGLMCFRSSLINLILKDTYVFSNLPGIS